jgi:replication initiation protein
VFKLKNIRKEIHLLSIPIFYCNYKDDFIKKMSKNQVLKTYQEFVKKDNRRKQSNLKLSEVAAELVQNERINLTQKRVKAITECGTFLQYAADKKIENRKLFSANFCNNRYCPICAKNKSFKDARDVKIITEYLHDLDYQFLFATFTAPNCSQEELKAEITKYNKALERMFSRKKYRFIKGYIRKLEITYNDDPESKSYQTFHPHFHVLICVNKFYFKNDYISKSQWLMDWRQAMKDSSITQVDIKKVSLDSRKNNIDKSILELTKYITKDFDFYSEIDVFENFYKGTKGKRMFAFSGLFKDAKKKLKNKELEKYAGEQKEIEWYYLFTQIYNQDKYIVKQESNLELLKCLLASNYATENINDEE